MSPPHPPLVEEESVKEVVLSETPLSKPPPSPRPEVLVPEKSRETHLPLKLLEPEPKEISEASLVTESRECSVSESFSYSTTTTITEVRDDDEAMSKRRREVGPRATANGSPSAMGARRKRPNVGEVAGRRGRGHALPGSRVDRSSEKRNRVEGKVVRGRESCQVRNTQLNGGYAGGVRRDIGEVSARRSRSPATRAAGGGSRGGLARNGSKGTGRTGGRSLGGVAEKGNGIGDNINKKKEEELSKVGCSQSQTGNESLENPLVSLECFIFV